MTIPSTRKMLRWAAGWAVTILLAYYVLSPLLWGYRPPVPIYSPQYLGAVSLGIALAETGRWLWRRLRPPLKRVPPAWWHQ